ncbi:hypothetical protein EBR96_08710 [bacterium]|nr:hypothetical protein [bacterium]
MNLTHKETSMASKSVARFGWLVLIAVELSVPAWAATQSELPIVRLLVSDIACKTCDVKLKSTLHKARGVTNVEVVPNDGSVKVTYDPMITSISTITARIERAGYRAQVATENQLKVENYRIRTF